MLDWDHLGAAKWLSIDPITAIRYRIEQISRSQFELAIFRGDDKRSFDRKPFNTHEDAARYADERAQHDREEAALGRVIIQSRVKTPWGRSRSIVDYGFGVTFYATTENDGYHLTDEANALIPEAFRSLDGWYQDDVEGVKVVLAMPVAFTQLEVQEATAAAEETMQEFLNAMEPVRELTLR